MKLYIYNDLPDFRKKGKEIAKLQHALLENPNVEFLTREKNIQNILQKYSHIPFGLTLGVGDSGEKIAHEMHKKSKWFPTIKKLHITRLEQENGQYTIISTSKKTIKQQLSNINVSSLAIVDDTLYSGLTLGTILHNLPEKSQKNVHIFCLQVIEESLSEVEELCQISYGFKMIGKKEKDISIIRASSLFQKGATVTKTKKLAFFEREEWMNGWFPKNASTIVSLCRKLRLARSFI